MDSTTIRVVTSKEVAAYEGMVEAHARRFDGTRGAEFDDLKQEGLIAVWLDLRAGRYPSNIAVVNAMRDWIRECARKGLTGDEFGFELVSLDEARDAEAAEQEDDLPERLFAGLDSGADESPL